MGTFRGTEVTMERCSIGFDDKHWGVIRTESESTGLGALMSKFYKSQGFQLGGYPAWAYFAVLYLNLF